MVKKKELKTNAMRFLEEHGVEYNHYEFDVKSDAAKTGVGVADIIGKEHNQVFKTIMTTDGKGNYVVGVLMSEDSINFKKLAKAVELKSLSMLPLKDLTTITGYVKGGCSPFAMKKLFPTIIDIKCNNVETIIISAGKVGHQIEVKPDVLVELIDAKIADISA
ncbi:MULTISPECIES: Cys-tRNA(Pro) deacylase [Gemella]|uniref:Cys-tRNA(Pro) deacylase n=1 Tax=Gemella TaxID=1378 RepID=UPI00076841F0|nr:MULTISPECIES: Cys-tRNA(Pro) deacylase [Gemella]AME08773.1 aminoacyl-tRNA deacylase [Gemella sp. oral taxon 928]AXI26348.1 Cys-tRNA(Pro) deacylase [Gemella sp. ND 6198]